jgi:hypothetical protein
MARHQHSIRNGLLAESMLAAWEQRNAVVLYVFAL